MRNNTGKMTDLLQNILGGANWLFNCGWVVALLVGLWWLLQIARQRHAYNDLLTSELAKHNLHYVSEKSPPLCSALDHFPR